MKALGLVPRFATYASAFSFLLLSASNGAAEEIPDILKRVDGYVAEKNYAKALDELSWARRELEKLQNQGLASVLPDTLKGYKGGKPESSTVMGFTNIEREYTGSGSASVKVSLVGGSSGGGNGLGGLAALGQFAALAGGQAGTDAVRIKGKTATIEESGSSKSITIFLDGGTMLKLEGNEIEVSDLKAMAEELPIDAIEKRIKG